MTTICLYAIWGAGLMVISMPVWATAEIPKFETDINMELVLFLMGLAFTAFMYVIKLIVDSIRKLNESVDKMNLKMALSDQRESVITTDIRKIKKRQDIQFDRLNKHENKHATCPACPAH